jgi:hypothetical protein
MRKQGEGFYLSGSGKGLDDFWGQVADGVRALRAVMAVMAVMVVGGELIQPFSRD